MSQTEVKENCAWTLGLILALGWTFLFALGGGNAEAAKRPYVSVFPSPGTPVASDQTTFSFRGIKPANLGPLRVVGAKSGRHGGRRLKHSDGRGVSFVPKRKFRRGEIVRVYTRKQIRSARKGNFHVRIARFASDDRRRSKPRAPNRFRPLVTRPQLRPPRLNVHKSGTAATKGKVFFAPKATGLTIADRLGRIAWFLPTGHGDRGQAVQDFKVQTYKGKPVLTYWRSAASRKGPYQFQRFHIRNQRYKKIARFTLGNGYQPDAHEFMISPRNTALVIAYRALKWDLRKFGGSRNGTIIDNIIQELDVKTGAVLFEWHSVGNVSIGDSVTRPGQARSWDYFHANSIEDDGDSFLVSARKVNTIYRINRKSGKIAWRLRGDGRRPKASSFKVGPKARFGYQHDARRLPNGDISLFDNSVAKRFRAVRKQSSTLVLRLRKGKAKLVKRFDHPARVLAQSQGGSEILPNGNVFVGWGSLPRISEFTPDGKLAFDATFTAPVNSYRARKAKWTGRPRGWPAIASLKGKKIGATVWASWNGATDVAHWRLLTGPDKAGLKEIKTVAWTGLETSIGLGKPGRQVRVEALDADGNVIGRSPVRPLGTRSHGKPRRLR